MPLTDCWKTDGNFVGQLFGGANGLKGVSKRSDKQLGDFTKLWLAFTLGGSSPPVALLPCSRQNQMFKIKK